jgi:signal transduction histidine kinase
MVWPARLFFAAPGASVVGVVTTTGLTPGAVQTRTRAFGLVIGLAAAAWATFGVAAIARGEVRDNTKTLAALTILAGLSFVAAGLVAWRGRPERLTGALMVGTGFALFAGTLVEANRSVPFTVGLALSPLASAVLAHLVLAFPDGRLHSGLERVLVVAAYINATALQITMLMFMGIENVGGCPCPRNLLFVRDDMSVHSALMNALRLSGIAIAAGVVTVVVRRWQSASPLLRRALAPILVTGGITAALLAALLIADQASAGITSGLQSAERVALATVPLAYLFGLFQTRLARVGLGELVVELGNNPAQAQLRDALARALRDPTLELGYWMPSSQEYVDVEGKQVDVVPTATRAVTLLERRGEKVAALVHDAALREDPVLLDAVSSAAGLALDNERLLAELRAQLAETRDSRARIVDAADTERRRLERNLHDGAQQRLVTLALHLRMAQESLHDDPAAAGAMLDGVGQDLKLALEELRELARGLHPAILTERGLAPALQSIATRAPFEVEISGVPEERLPAAIEAGVYYVVAESLTNAAKHAGASAARVELSTGDDTVVVEIRDNGGGGANLAKGSGIRGLADRVEALGGRFELQSPVGAGTVVRAELPLR